MGENTCKWCDQQWLNFQNIQTAHTTNSNKKQTLPKNGQKTFHEGCSPLLIITEMHIKITTRYHFLSARMVIIKKSTNNKCWRGCGEKGTLLHHRWECVGKLMQPLWKTVRRLLKKLNIHTHTESQKEWNNPICRKRKDIPSLNVESKIWHKFIYKTNTHTGKKLMVTNGERHKLGVWD